MPNSVSTVTTQENQLHEYAAAGSFEALKELIDALIKQRMSIETIFNRPHTEFGTRFLSFAIQNGHLNLIKRLADEYSEKVNLGNCSAEDDILYWCRLSTPENRTEMLNYFLENAKKFNLSEANIQAALGNQDYFKSSPDKLLTPDKNGLTSLYYAIIANQENIIALTPEATLSEIIQVARQDPGGLAAVYYNLGNAYVRNQDYDSAIRVYEESIELRIQISEPTDQDRRDLATTYSSLGNVYVRKGDYASAINAFEKSIALREQIDVPTDQDRRGLATIYNNLGDTHVKKGDDDSAISAFDKAIELRKQITDPRDLDRRDLATFYNNLGNAYVRKHDDDSAISAYEKSIALRGQPIVSTGQDRGDYCRRWLAITYFYLGNVYVRKQCYAFAISAFSEALKFQMQITYRADRDPRDLAIIYRSLGASLTRQFAIEIQHFNYREPKENCLKELGKATESSCPIECIPLLKALYETIQKTTDSEEPLRRIANYGVEFSNSLIETDNQPVLDKFFPKLFLFCEASIKNNPPNMEAISQLRILVLLILKFKDKADIPQNAVDKLNQCEQELKAKQLRLQGIIESCNAPTLVALHAANENLYEELAAKNMRIAELEAQVEKLEKTQEQAKEQLKEIQPASRAVNDSRLWSNANKRKHEEENDNHNQNKQARTPINSQTFSPFERA